MHCRSCVIIVYSIEVQAGKARSEGGCKRYPKGREGVRAVFAPKESWYANELLSPGFSFWPPILAQSTSFHTSPV